MHLGCTPPRVCPPSVLMVIRLLTFNRLADNYPEPFKRPLSSTTPTIIEDEHGEFLLAIGGSGGSRIFGAVFQVILNLHWGLDVSAAIEFGRLHDQLFPSEVEIDDVYPHRIVEELKDKGHNVTGKGPSWF